MYPFSFKSSPLLSKLNIYFGKQKVKLKKDFTKVSRVDLHQSPSIYATVKLLAQFSFGSALKME